MPPLLERLGVELPVVQAGMGGGGAYYLGAYPTPELLDALWAGPLAKFIPAGSLLAGRVGYAVVIPATDWLRTPRRGGAATVSVSVQPTDGVPFSTVAEERFP